MAEMVVVTAHWNQVRTGYSPAGEGVAACAQIEKKQKKTQGY